MKSDLIKFSVLCLFAGSACAQSSVTVFGVVDLGLRAVKNGDGGVLKSLTRDGLSSSRLGFRGEEDLGSGLRASFWLEAALAADTGAAGTTTGNTAANGAVASGKFFDRRSTMSLSSSNFGELRLGRDYTPTFTNLSAFDVYGSTGFAGEANLLGGGSPTAIGTLGSGAGTLGRADNSIGYFLPRLGGVYGTVMVAAGEGTNTSNGNNRYVGARVGYAAGSLDVAGAYGRTSIPNNNDFRVWNAGIAYDFSVVKLTLLYHQADYTPTGLANRFQKLWVTGVRVPVGAGEVRVTYQRSNIGGGTTPGLRDQDDASQAAVGYLYNFSKRTAVYVDAGRIRNAGLSALTMGGGTTVGSNLGTLPDRNSTAYELGLRHSF